MYVGKAITKVALEKMDVLKSSNSPIQVFGEIPVKKLILSKVVEQQQMGKSISNILYKSTGATQFFFFNLALTLQQKLKIT